MYELYIGIGNDSLSIAGGEVIASFLPAFYYFSNFKSDDSPM